MFDENQRVVVKWCSKNKKYYTNLGIHYTRMGDSFEIEAKFLMPNSSVNVNCICDYCGKDFITQYHVYKRSALRGKLCCGNCKKLKIEDVLLTKYGKSSVGSIDFCKQRAKETMIHKYGCEYALQCAQGQANFKKSMIEKYGKDNPSFCSELLSKSRVTAYNNGTSPTSLPERNLLKILKEIYGEENCIGSFPVDQVSLDCLLQINGIKIDIEYDGWYWHKDTKDKDRKRNHWLISKGYKVIRILGNPKDILPSKERLIEEVNYILEGHEIGYIDMNN